MQLPVLHYLFFLVTLLNSCVSDNGYEPARQLLDPELAQIPLDILACYADRRLWERYNRLPMSIASLSAIIRKVGEANRKYC